MIKRIIKYLFCLAVMISSPCFAQLTHVPVTGDEISGYEFSVNGMSFRILDMEAHDVALIDRSAKLHSEGFGAYGDLKEIPATVEYDNETYHVIALMNVYCRFSKELSLPESIVEISGSFEMTDWNQFVFPKYLKTIGNNCFRECNDIVEFNFPQALNTIGANCFINNEKLEKVNFGTNLRSIGDNSFSQNPNLNVVELPNSLASIGKGAFYRCGNLQYVKLPRWLPYEYGSREDALEMFNGCPSIKVIEWESETPMALPDCFGSVRKSECTVIVPDGFKGVYMENDYWKQFNIVEKSDYRAGINEVESSVSVQPLYYLLNGLSVSSEDNIATGETYIKVEGDVVSKLIK